MLERELKGEFLIDSDVFLSYFKADELVKHSEKVINLILDNKIIAYVSSILYDDLVTCLLSVGVDIDMIINTISRLSAIPHISLPLSPVIVITALRLYKKFGGPRKLHYFDSYHVATSQYYDYPLITSDKFIIENADKLKIDVINLREI